MEIFSKPPCLLGLLRKNEQNLDYVSQQDFQRHLGILDISSPLPQREK